MSGFAAGSGPAAIGLGGVALIFIGQTALGIVMLILSGLVTIVWALIMKS